MARLVRLVLTYDFAPRMTAPVRRAVTSPLGVLLVAAAVAGLCGLALHPRVFALAGGLLGVAAAGVCWPWLSGCPIRSETPVILRDDISKIRAFRTLWDSH